MLRVPGIGTTYGAQSTGHRVGYESPSQFSREYRRLIGAPPRIEIARLREVGVEA